MNSKEFILGMLFMCCLNSLIQDMLGKGIYIEMVKHNWVPGWITVPLAIIGIIIINILLVYGHKEKS